MNETLLNNSKEEESDKRIKVLEAIVEDTKNDAEDFDGRPFNGKTVAEYFGNHGAAIAALANIMKLVLKLKGKEERYEKEKA